MKIKWSKVKLGEKGGKKGEMKERKERWKGGMEEDKKVEKQEGRKTKQGHESGEFW